ncbi:Protein CBG27297 [Caenorhabditis briggsae]|uniref:Protein CBG27297 n=1 Tax=Caenorhabditis briggsae TaxID=6238 RepID=B6IM74_CAEBR|nr:Protein CBG27297 [Caenorhabditis briggsae]CAS01004.1 Protein CBG27297 [Caenorhabditis briggsae]
MLRTIPILILILLVQGDGNVAFEEDLFSNFTFVNSTNSTTTIPKPDFTDTIIFALKLTIFLVMLVFCVLGGVHLYINKGTPLPDGVKIVPTPRLQHRNRANREENFQ